MHRRALRKLTRLAMTVSETDKCQFQIRSYRGSGGKVSIDRAPRIRSTGGESMGKDNMPCNNHECPFYEVQSGDTELSAALHCVITDAVKEVRFESGEELFAEGQSRASLFAIHQGLVKITSHTADGRERIVGLSHPGKMLVGLQSLNDEHYQYSAVAATDVVACKIRHRALLTAVRNQGDIALRLIDAINAQLKHSRALLNAMGQKSAAAKIAAFILLVVPKSVRGSQRFTLPFSRGDIANMLGLSEETVCRQMAELKRMDILYAPRGTIEIHDWKKLQAIADERHDGNGAADFGARAARKANGAAGRVAIN